ncbi:MAG: NUDIX domain-containing protein, partial [Bacteroidota bacterium]
MKKSTFRKHLSVDCVIFGYDESNNKLEVLLIEQKDPALRTAHSYRPQFAIPGDLIDESESLDEAATRVLKELTHVEGLHLKQFHTFGDPMRVKQEKDKEWLAFYRSDPDARVVTIAYYT